jgi:hypothetical protein
LTGAGRSQSLSGAGLGHNMLQATAEDEAEKENKSINQGICANYNK